MYTKEEKTKIRKRAQQVAELLGLNYNDLLIELQAQFIENNTDKVFERLLKQEEQTNGRK